MNRINICLLLSLIFATSNAQNISDGLVAYYPFSGNAFNAIADDYHASVVGAVLSTDRLGNSNAAYHFDGTNDYIEIAQSADLLTSNTEFSVSFWFKADALKSMNLVGKGADHLGNFTTQQDWATKIIYSNGIGQIGAHVNSESINPNTNLVYESATRASIQLNTNDWYHVVMTWDRDSLRMYINGELDTTDVTDNSFDLSTRFNLSFGGSSSLAGLKPERFFSGSIDEVRVYNRTIALNEIRLIAQADSGAAYNCNNKSIEDYLVGYYPFDGNANDESGNSYHATVTGAILCPDRSGQSAKAYHFDGVDDFIEVLNSHNMIPTEGPMSVCFWFKTNQYKLQNLVGKSVDCLGSFKLYQDWGTKLIVGSEGNQFGASINSSNLRPGQNDVFFDVIRSESQFDTSQWFHLTMTYDRDELKLYVNGVLDSSKSSSDDYYIGNRFNLTFGGSSVLKSLKPDRYFSGEMDEIRIYSRLLCEDDIEEIMNADAVASVKNLKQTLISIYPNPQSKGSISLNINALNHIEQAYIYTLEGKLLPSLLNGNQLFFEAQSGIYFIKLNEGGQWSTHRLLVY